MSSDHIPTTGGVRTLGTLVWLLAGMCALVSAEVVTAGEDLTADAAHVRLDARMQPHVARQHVTAGKGPVAGLAHIVLGRRVALLTIPVPTGHVLRQAVVKRECLPAQVTRVRGGHVVQVAE